MSDDANDDKQQLVRQCQLGGLTDVQEDVQEKWPLPQLYSCIRLSAVHPGVPYYILDKGGTCSCRVIRYYEETISLEDIASAAVHVSYTSLVAEFFKIPNYSANQFITTTLLPLATVQEDHDTTIPISCKHLQLHVFSSYCQFAMGITSEFQYDQYLYMDTRAPHRVGLWVATGTTSSVLPSDAFSTRRGIRASIDSNAFSLPVRLMLTAPWHSIALHLRNKMFSGTKTLLGCWLMKFGVQKISWVLQATFFAKEVLWHCLRKWVC